MSVGPRVLLVGANVERGAAAVLRRRLRASGEFDLVIAVDGGVSACRALGVRADFAMGDWDSLPRSKKARALRALPHVTFSRDKDRSDLFFAAQAALAIGAGEVVAVGVTGGRPDHHLA